VEGSGGVVSIESNLWEALNRNPKDRVALAALSDYLEEVNGKDSVMVRTLRIMIDNNWLPRKYPYTYERRGRFVSYIHWAWRYPKLPINISNRFFAYAVPNVTYIPWEWRDISLVTPTPIPTFKDAVIWLSNFI
jgi:hypothetical protein